jgi:hypothetical protein
MSDITTKYKVGLNLLSFYKERLKMNMTLDLQKAQGKSLFFDYATDPNKNESGTQTFGTFVSMPWSIQLSHTPLVEGSENSRGVKFHINKQDVSWLSASIMDVCRAFMAGRIFDGDETGLKVKPEYIDDEGKLKCVIHATDHFKNVLRIYPNTIVDLDGKHHGNFVASIGNASFTISYEALVDIGRYLESIPALDNIALALYKVYTDHKEKLIKGE